MGWVIVLAPYLLLVELRVPVAAALVVTIVGVVASPAFLLYRELAVLRLSQRHLQRGRCLVPGSLPPDHAMAIRCGVVCRRLGPGAG